MKFIAKLRRSEKGQSLLEFALVFPIFLLLLFGMIDYSRVSTADTQITNATQEAAKEFVHLADTPEYKLWYIEDLNKANNEKRINNELKTLVGENVNTVPNENIILEAQRITDNDDKLGDRVSVKVTAKVPSLTQLTFNNVNIERTVTLRIPSSK